MKLTLEWQALGWAAMAAALSVGGALSIAHPIHLLSNSSPAGATSPDPPSASETTMNMPKLADQGGEFFAMSCSQCHGDDAHGDEGPDLHNLPISNTRIATTIKNGIKGEMPTFGKKYADGQIAALVAYLRTLR
jgi:mono/diheme cytochrome c family protein